MPHFIPLESIYEVVEASVSFHKTALNLRFFFCPIS
nr:MAG TPA: hypothetical protein [Caudoviricetes sp.]